MPTKLHLNIPPPQNKNNTFHPTNQVYSSTKNNYTFGPYKANFSIKFCSEGSENYWINEELVVLSAGEYLIIDQDADVYYEAKKVHQGFSIFLDPSINGNGLITHKTLCDVEDFGRWLKHALMSNHTLDHSFFTQCKNYLQSSHAKLKKQITRISRKKKDTQIELSRNILRSAKYMNEHVQSPFDLHRVAEEAYMSKYHFTRFFKEFYGMTPWFYFQKRRMENACRLLKTSDQSIKELTKQYGFSQVSAFTRSFKEHIGMTPTDYRTKHQIDQSR